MIIADFDKSQNEIVRVQTAEFRAKRYVDIRDHVRGVDGQLMPTRKGIILKGSSVKKVITALEAAVQTLGKEDSER